MTVSWSGLQFAVVGHFSFSPSDTFWRNPGRRFAFYSFAACSLHLSWEPAASLWPVVGQNRNPLTLKHLPKRDFVGLSEPGTGTVWRDPALPGLASPILQHWTVMGLEDRTARGGKRGGLPKTLSKHVSNEHLKASSTSGSMAPCLKSHSS